MSRRRRRWAWPGCSPQETTESDQKTVKKVKLSSSQTKPDDATRTEEGLYFRQLLPVTGLREAGPIWQTTPPRCNDVPRTSQNIFNKLRNFHCSANVPACQRAAGGWKTSQSHRRRHVQNAYSEAEGRRPRPRRRETSPASYPRPQDTGRMVTVAASVSPCGACAARVTPAGLRIARRAKGKTIQVQVPNAELGLDGARVTAVRVLVEENVSSPTHEDGPARLTEKGECRVGP